ncbi:MAG: ATP-binding cassette domain-containing protein [Candidatus Omnitrophica bacterium]|nr:ATP-binding cassette domain-containing protein [Candidatus Omnitrophota bacterium]
MALISLKDISLAFGGPLLFEQLNMQLEPGERVALLGRNGVGKTTLMKVMAGQIPVDLGEIAYQKGVKLTHLPQEIPSDVTGCVFDIVLAGLGERAQMVKEYHHVSHLLHTEQSDKLLRRLDDLQHQMDHANGWEINNQVEYAISQVKIDPDSNFEELSGGQKRKVLLARALVCNPEILMLDEPTNHLDIESITWLEEFLKAYKGTLFFVTHDRAFMNNLATRIVELDQGRIFSWTCGYDLFLERKAQALETEAMQQFHFEKKLAKEEVWVRQGVKARRTRDEGRVKALEAMRKEKQAQRQAIGQVKMRAEESERSGNLVIKANNLGFAYDNKCLVKDFSTRIMRGDKIGVIGPNGSGKTTLLRILVGQLAPQQGEVKIGTKIDLLYYDQLREALDEDKSVKENISGDADMITVNGKPKHVISYLQDFLFSPQRAQTPVRVLSGGERNRLLLARLFTKPSNVLIMDEPTNDLDIETLELLEDLLVKYSGTLFLVSHDRVFLNNIATSTIVMEGYGRINEYPGGYDDWLNQRQKKQNQHLAKPKPAASQEKNKLDKNPKPKKLSFKQAKELQELPLRIEQLEAEQKQIFNTMAQPDLYKKEPGKIKILEQRAEQIKQELPEMYKRWEELELIKGEE